MCYEACQKSQRSAILAMGCKAELERWLSLWCRQRPGGSMPARSRAGQQARQAGR